MKWQGLSKTKILKTSNDVLTHSYGQEAAVPAPAPVAVPQPPPPPPTVEVEESSAEEMAGKLVSDYTKNDLIEMAEQAGLDSSGTKLDIAMRLVKNQVG